MLLSFYVYTVLLLLFSVAAFACILFAFYSHVCHRIYTFAHDSIGILTARFTTNTMISHWIERKNIHFGSQM